MKYLIALIGLSLPAYLLRFELSGIPTTALEILIYLVFILGLINIRKAQKFDSKLWWPIGLWLLSALVAVCIAPDKRVALGQFKAFFLDPIMVFWLVVSFIKIKDLVWVIGGLFGSAMIVSVHALWQKITGALTPDGRVVGIFGYSPNYLALFFAPVIVWQIVHILSLKKKTALLVVSYSLLILINIAALYFSGSRGGSLALAGGLAAYLVLTYWEAIKKKVWLKIIIGLVIAGSLTAAGWILRPDFSLSPNSGSRTVSSNNIRWQIWGASLELGQLQPVLGVGLGNFQNAFTELTRDRANFPEYISPWALTPHNWFLNIWLVLGIPGLIAFIWLIVIFFRLGQKNPNPLAKILMATMVAMILQGLVDTPYFKNDLSVIFWLLFGFMLLLNKDLKSK